MNMQGGENMDTQKIAKFIKERRTEKGLTQKELAEMLGCTDKAVSRWETGKGMPDISFLSPLSDALGVSVSELIAGEKFLGEVTYMGENKKENAAESDVIKELVKKNDETLVGVMSEHKKEKKRLDAASILTAVLCCFQVFVFFGLPNLLPDSLSPIVFMILITILESVALGIFGNNSKWLFPLFNFLLLFVVNAAHYTPEGWGAAYIGFIFAISSLGIIAVCTTLRLLFRRLLKNEYRP